VGVSDTWVVDCGGKVFYTRLHHTPTIYKVKMLF